MAKPRRVRRTTKGHMDAIALHLFVTTVATIDQLSRLVHVKVPALRHQIKRYKLLSVGKRPLIRCATHRDCDPESWEWHETANTAVYQLSHDAAVAVETAIGNAYYGYTSAGHPLSTDTGVIRRAVLMTELYVRIVDCGMSPIQWLNSLQFNTELNRQRNNTDVSAVDPVNVTCGALVDDDDLSGLSMYDNESLKGIGTIVKRLVPKGPDADLYRLIVLVTGHRSGAAAVQCAGLPPRWIMVKNPDLPQSPSIEAQVSDRPKSDVRSNAVFISYEWALTYPSIFRDILARDWDRVMWMLLQDELDIEDKGLKRIEGTIWWHITDKYGRPLELVCTAIGRRAGTVGQLARLRDNYRMNDRLRRRVIVATEEEARVWQDVAFKYGGGYVSFEAARVPEISPFGSQEEYDSFWKAYDEMISREY